MVYGELIGHVIDDVTWSPKDRTRDANMLRAKYLNISKKARDAIYLATGAALLHIGGSASQPLAIRTMLSSLVRV